ncbi:MAG TPA: hypothetical protein DCQ83_06150, partial [Fibrobacteres bacterium]|nr:hypothetical protein [Fibrobacterota bacterium]
VSAVEAEVYGSSMFLVMTISWLTLYWYENRGTPKADRALILIGYLGFLGMGIHPFSFITMPVVGLFILLTDADSRANVPLFLASLALLSLIYDIGNFIVYAGAALVVCVVGLLMVKSPQWKRRWSLSTWMCIVALLGFSSYLYVPIRSMTIPRVDEGEARTWPLFKEYLERKQYGSEGMLTRALHRRAHVQNQFLVYPHMGYGGYMLQQYVPWKVGETRAEDNEPVIRHVFGKDVNFKTLHVLLQSKPQIQFLLFLLMQLPFLYGGYLVYRRNRQLGIYLLVLYAVTSYGLLFYMNFADGSQLEMRDYDYWKSTGFDPNQKPPPVHLEVRDRDYFFTPGFIYMGILFGISAVFLLRWIAARRGALVRPLGIILAGLAFAVPVWSNYKEHNRTGDYVPWDYAYNLLMSCRPNSILFTNGDNDTFPVWFLQEVEGVRKDVRVVNLSLANTNWYLQQLTEHEPYLKIGFNREQIDALQPMGWQGKGPMDIQIPHSKIRYQLGPLPYLKVQDIMVLHIVMNNYPEKPIHFAITVGDENEMGLDKFTVMEGMVYTLVEDPVNKVIDPVATSRMVDSVYRFRGLGDPKVYIDLNTEGLLTNYSSTNFHLVTWAHDTLQVINQALTDLRKVAAPSDSVKARIAVLEKARADKIAFAEKYLALNMRILPREWRVHYYAGQLYGDIGETQKAEESLRRGIREAGDGPNSRIFAMNLAQLYSQNGQNAKAESTVAEMYAQMPDDFEAMYTLAGLYQRRGELRKTRDLFAEWLARNPGHQYASPIAQQIQQLDAQMRTPPAPAVQAVVPTATTVQSAKK